MTSEEKIEAFYKAALFMKERVENDGWHPRSNYLREHAACASGLAFSNSESPEILDALRSAHPELRPYIVVKRRKAKK